MERRERDRMIDETESRATLTDEADCPGLLVADVVLVALAGNRPVERFVKRLMGDVVLVDGVRLQ